MLITQSGYADFIGVTRNTACTRLAALPQFTRDRVKRYHIADVLPTVRASERDRVPALFAAAELADDDLYLGDGDQLARADRLIDWLDDAQRSRLTNVQTTFVVALANSPLCTPAVIENLPALQKLVILHPAILVPVALGGDFPVMSEWASPFAIVNNTYFPTLEAAA